MPMAILAVSLIVQLVTAVKALTLVRPSGARAWALISAALLLMAVRRAVTLYKALGSDAAGVDPAAESVALLISLLMLAGVWMAGEALLRLNRLRREAEEEAGRRRRAEEEARASEARFHAIFDAAEGVPVQGYDSNRRVIFWNRASELLYGYSREEAMGRPLEELIIPGPMREAVVEGHRRWIEEGEPIPAGELVLVNSAGEDVPVYSSHVMIESAKYGSEMFCIDVDLSEQKRNERERQRMQKLEGLGTVAGGIAHDFNNLLTGVFGNIEMAAGDLPEGHPSRAALERSHQALRAARRLTNRLLTFARGGNPVMVSLDLPDCIRDTVAFNLSGSSVAPVLDLPEDLRPVCADRGQLEQVISNLTINAQQAMPSGGCLHVSARNLALGEGEHHALHAGHYVKLELRDEGAGIPEDVIERIFDPYFTTKRSGSGLGLAVVHSIVARHGGHIAVESTPGEGCTFAVFLPAGGEQEEEEPAGETARLQKSPAGVARALVMDDEQTVRAITSEMLRRLGFEVETVEEGGSALAAYRSALDEGRRFDLVVMDLTIPGGMGGREAVRKVLELDPEARVMVASGYSSDPVLADPRSFGFRAALAKPFLLEELEEGVAKALGDR